MEHSYSPHPQSPSRLIITMACIVIALGIGLVYGKTVGFEFVNFDDSEYVTQNLHVQEGLTGDGLRWAFTTFHGANWFPVTWLSHMLDAQLFGPWPGGHHLTSALIHVANSLLLGLLLFRLTGAFWKSACVAALFALHPLHVESVAWVSERKDVLSTFFFLAALGTYIRYTSCCSLSRYLLVMVFFALGLMAKPMLVTFPLILLLLDWWPLHRFTTTENTRVTLPGKPGRQQRLRPLVIEKIPLLLMSLASAIITILAQKQGEALVSAQVMPVLLRIGRMFVHYCWYIAKLFWPADLAFFYPAATSLPPWNTLVAAACILAVSAFVITKARSRPFLAVGWFWFLVTLLPVIGLVAVGMQGTADRYAYIPSIGMFMAWVWQTDAVLEKTDCRYKLAIVCSTVLLGILSLVTWRQVEVWRTSTTLSAHAVAVTTDNYVAMTVLGDTLDDAGRSSEAISQYTSALQIRPDYEVARNSLGVALCRQGRIEEAMGAFTTALRLRPTYADAYINMGVCMTTNGRRDEAEHYFRKALRIKPDNPIAAEYLQQTMGDIAPSEPEIRR